jgi:PTS system nitrogen regulatory IIA component
VSPDQWSDCGGDLEMRSSTASTISPGEVREELYEKLMERERLASTGIGNGIAIPHPREPLSKPPETPAITTCFLEKGFNTPSTISRCLILFYIDQPDGQTPPAPAFQALLLYTGQGFRIDFLQTHPDAAALHFRVAEFEKQLDDL